MLKAVNKLFLLKIFLFCFLFIIISAPALHASDEVINKNFVKVLNVQKNAIGNNDETSISTIITNVLKIALSFLGVIFVILIIWSGAQWMTAGGNATIIETAKKRIINSVIGLVIVLGAFAITEFVLDNIISAVETEQ